MDVGQELRAHGLAAAVEFVKAITEATGEVPGLDEIADLADNFTAYIGTGEMRATRT
jgi:hypothetical protein